VQVAGAVHAHGAQAVGGGQVDDVALDRRAAERGRDRGRGDLAADAAEVSLAQHVDAVGLAGLDEPAGADQRGADRAEVDVAGVLLRPA
jgi:hypothetical protein